MRVPGLSILAIVITIACVSSAVANPTRHPIGAAILNTQVLPTMPPIERLFISGHSLTDPPLASNLVLMSQSLGGPKLQWNMQSMQGSSIHQRTHGERPEHAYRRGTNRDGADMNVLDEWRNPATVQGGHYDTLLVTERHGVLSSLTWQHTLESLQGVHHQFVQANPRGRTLFFEAWLGIDDKNNPARWIAYERAASPVWRCVVARVNASIAAQGRSDRVQSIPTGTALVTLVERALQGKVAGISGGRPRQVVDRLLGDDVHLTPWGSYFMASVVYAALWGRSPEGADAPADVPPDVAASLQHEAWGFVNAHQASVQIPSMHTCRDALKQGFITQHWSYVRDTQWAPEKGRPRAYLDALRQWFGWQRRIRSRGPDNPFRD